MNQFLYKFRFCGFIQSAIDKLINHRHYYFLETCSRPLYDFNKVVAFFFTERYCGAVEI